MARLVSWDKYQDVRYKLAEYKDLLQGNKRQFLIYDSPKGHLSSRDGYATFAGYELY